MKSAMLRYAVISMLAVGALSFTGNAQAVSGDGVNIPEADLIAGTGNQIVDITIGAGSPVVGSADELDLSIDDTYVIGVTAAGAGGSCSDWTCEPGSSGWRAGTIQLTVSTAKVTPCTGSGVLYNCERAPVELQILGGGMPVIVTGSILITAATQPTQAPTTKPTKTASPKTRPSQPSNTGGVNQATAKQSGQDALSSSTAAAAPSQSASSAVAAATPSASAAIGASFGGTGNESPGSLTVADASSSRPDSPTPWIFGGAAIAVVLLGAAFVGWRWASRSRG